MTRPPRNSVIAPICRRVWESPTANTWVSLFTRSVSLVLVLPMVLRHFSTAEAAVWFVFSSVIAVQGVLGFGFNPSFGRLLAYARAGADPEDMFDLRGSRTISRRSDTNWNGIDRLCACMRRVFAGLALVSLFVTATLGTMAVRRPIVATGTGASHAWIAWGLVIAGSSLSFWTTYYVSLLQGMDRLTEWRRWETVTSLGAIFSGFITLLAGGGLLALVAANQVWVAIAMLVFRQVAYRICDCRLSSLGRRKSETFILRLVWNSAWKTGLTNVLSQGLVQSTGVVQAQFGNAATTATYNFTLRIVTVLSQVAQAPFITKLPELARRRAVGDLPGQVALIRRGMRLTHWSITGGVVSAALLLPPTLKVIGSKSVVFDPLLWSLFGLTIFFDRHGGMLNQIRNLTNKPMEHVGIIGYFALNLGLMIALHGKMNIYAYPLAMLGTQLLFGLWFSAAMAYPVIGAKPIAFESTVSIPPFVVLIAVTTASILFSLR